jgi:hypothetical protein
LSYNHGFTANISYKTLGIDKIYSKLHIIKKYVFSICLLQYNFGPPAGTDPAVGQAGLEPPITGNPMEPPSNLRKENGGRRC